MKRFPPSRLPVLNLPLAAAFFLAGSMSLRAAEPGLLHSSTFETSQGFKPGNLDGQNGWKVESGTAEVSGKAAHADDQGLIIYPSTPAGSVSLSVALPEGDSSNVVYTDVWVRPGADDLSGKGFSEAQGAYTGFFRVAAGGELYVFNGDGQGGGQWLPTQVQLPVEDSGQARDWIRLSMRQDYLAKVWDLYINGTIFRANMGFWKDAAESQTKARFVFTGTTAQSLLLDDFSVSTDSLLFADADHDGLPDEWEKAQGLDAANGERDDDPDADGLTNVEELVLGTQPLVSDSDGDGLLDGAAMLAGSDLRQNGKGSTGEGNGLAEFTPGGLDLGTTSSDDRLVSLGDLKLAATRAWHEFESSLFGGASFALPSFPKGADAQKVSFEEAMRIASPFWQRLSSVSKRLSLEIVNQLVPSLDSAVPWDVLAAEADRGTPLTVTQLNMLFGFALRIDRDGDGLSDWQEWQLKNSPSDANPEADDDGDTFSNIAEAINGTDARDPNDNPATRSSGDGQAAVEGAVDVFTSFQATQSTSQRRVLREKRGGGVFDIGPQHGASPQSGAKPAAAPLK